jgi:hypothetical protein
MGIRNDENFSQKKKDEKKIRDNCEDPDRRIISK